MPSYTFTLAEGDVELTINRAEDGNRGFLKPNCQKTQISIGSDVAGTGGALDVFVRPTFGENTVLIENEDGSPANVFDALKFGPGVVDGAGEIVSFGGPCYGIKFVNVGITGPTEIQINVAQIQT